MTEDNNYITDKDVIGVVGVFDEEKQINPKNDADKIFHDVQLAVRIAKKYKNMHETAKDLLKKLI